MRYNPVIIFLILNYVSSCEYNLVETIPEGMNLKTYVNDTYLTFLDLIRTAKKYIFISSFYWSLKCNDTSFYIEESCKKGETVLNYMIAAMNKGVKIYIVSNDNNKLKKSKKKAKVKNPKFQQNFTKENLYFQILKNSNLTNHSGFQPASNILNEMKSNNLDFKNEDLALLNLHGAYIRLVNLQKFFGSGILHTKFIVSDNQTLYLGSSNMDWRSFTHVKELGITMKNCSLIANDLLKIFEIYWSLGLGELMPSWPKEWDTHFNKKKMMDFKLKNFFFNAYLTSSPKRLATTSRTVDIDALLDVINSAEKYINIEVMNYSPTFIFTKNLYWSKIDNALRSAVINKNIQIKIIVADWKSTNCNSLVFLNSLNELSLLSVNRGIKVKLFKVPSDEKQIKIPFARVNHDKFMVTDKHVFISTSNWSADYFVFTAGVSFVGKNFKGNRTMREDLDYIFYRDWNSNFARNIIHVDCKIRQNYA